ncbi:tripartite tricarboxylate transporter permease [Nanoarchaeota archaeon]
MYVQILVAIALGLVCGIITGLIPGIHVNLISVLALTLSPIILTYTSPIALCCFIISLAITHSFLDSIPSIYLGAPDADQALNVLPGHRLLHQGQGHNAILYTLIGSLGSLILALILFPFIIPLMKTLHPYIKNYIGYALIAIMSYMILKEPTVKKKLSSFLLFTLAGILGLIVLNLPSLSQPLFPLLSGLFGLSILITSLLQKSTIPKQSPHPLTISKKNTTKAITASTGMGITAAFLPGFGSSQAAIIATQLVGKIGDEGFLTLVGGINTANMLVSIATAYTLSKARNGAIVVVNQLIETITTQNLLIFLSLALIVGGTATLIAIPLSKKFANIITRFSYTKIITSIIIFITLLTIIFDTWIGLLILTTSTAIGLLATNLGVGKNHLMGCLIIPVILFFIL